MSNWDYLNKCRYDLPGYPHTDASWGFNGAFKISIPGEARQVCIIASGGGGWKHVSVSFGQRSTKTPSWEVMCAVKDLFWEPEDVVMQLHPAKSEYVNCHPGCLHLWQPTDVAIPTPPAHFVGPLKGPMKAEEIRYRNEGDLVRFLKENLLDTNATKL